MTVRSKYLFIASMDVEPRKEALFNEVYNKEHCPELMGVSGVVSVARFEKQPFTVLIGGEARTIKVEGEPRYHALYELESPDVLTSDAWGEAVERGRWPEQVRPYTKNRRHTLLRLTYPQA